MLGRFFRTPEMHCAAFDGTNQDLVRMLVVAEADEVFMDAQGVGWNCGYSNGEALSRILATELYPAQLDGFASASAWLNSPRQDFVNQNDPTDQTYESIGCAALFVNYLHNQTGFAYPLDQIVQKGGPTLTQTYQNLTGNNDDPFPAFAALLNTKFAIGARRIGPTIIHSQFNSGRRVPNLCQFPDGRDAGRHRSERICRKHPPGIAC